MPIPEIPSVEQLVGRMPIEERRSWAVKIAMRNLGINFADIARRHRFTRWYIAGVVNGVHPWSPKVVLALEAELGVSLRSLLNDTELDKLNAWNGGE
jgi:hypothetical protein